MRTLSYGLVSACGLLALLPPSSVEAQPAKAQPSAVPAATPATATPATATTATTVATAATAATAAVSTATGTPSQAASVTCTERVPEGKARPEMTESFPALGKAGHRAVLRIEVRHGPGERVLPSAIEVDSNSPAYRGLRSAGFRLPEASGPAAPKLSRAGAASSGDGVTRTEFSLPILLLPDERGRQELILPSLPIAIARSSGEIITLCTQPHPIVVEDPTANAPNAEPKRNPAPRRQLELWQTLKNLAYGGAIGLLIAAVFAVLLRRWLKRPKRQPPPPAPRPAWDVALEALHDIRQARLIEAGRFGEHFDRVSHVLRLYVGERYGFDGLERTTREILSALSEKGVAEETSSDVRRFLDESDLVKFAKLMPTEAQCHWLWETAEAIVRRTRPVGEPVAKLEEPALEAKHGE